MDLTFRIPEEKKDLFIDAWGVNWNETIPNPDNPEETIPNPQTKAQFAKAQIKMLLSDRVKNYEGSQIPEIGIT